ncbi:hypothetical protein QMZ65_02325 [Pantoea sp. EABMAA-21]|uniref:hypothetical protein n=1 Tax=Pantoea sp. EABMAA-21 TaxID=3043302 RepID=UPI0024B5C76C|nr:hypothetical protein [Pantoea sp. EABMAA-21]MDI9276038.1 hypothetical protein [Pantoea sp. EABMAA-21]
MAHLTFRQLISGEADHPIELALILFEKLALFILQLVMQLFAYRDGAIALAIGIDERNFKRGYLRRLKCYSIIPTTTG